MAAYYNENDKFAAAWLRELIKAKLRLAKDGWPVVTVRNVEDALHL